MEKMQVEIVAREIIKPSYATPVDKKVHSLSFFDQVSPRLYGSIAFLYTEEEIASHSLTSNELISGRLKSSLSSALTQYYPLAGRIKDNATVDCNDEGVVYIEARAPYTELSHITRDTTGEGLHSLVKQLFPENLPYSNSISSGPAVVQVTFFSCGGMCVAMCICHKIMDFPSIFNFMKCWATMAREGDAAASKLVPPEFNLGSMYPPIKDLEFKQPGTGEVAKYAGCRLVISASKVAKLKEMVQEKVRNPTRTEVVLAFLLSCAVSAKNASSGSPRPWILHQAVNMRKRVFPNFPDIATGNLTGACSVWTSGETNETDLSSLVGEIRRGKTEFFNNYANVKKEELVIRTLEGWKRRPKDRDSYRTSSLCGFPVYEVVDFGWGKPVWVTKTCCEFTNAIVMMSTRGGGVEVFITLGEEEMVLFQRDEKLLQFALVNPCGLPDSDS